LTTEQSKSRGNMVGHEATKIQVLHTEINA